MYFMHPLRPMGKKYLLLRNNKQTGPYTLEELAGEGFKKYDLIWVEGESAGWRSPHEIAAIQALLQSAPPAAPVTPASEKPKSTTTSNRHIFVRMPGGGGAVTTNVSNVVPATAAVEELTPEQKLEQKAALLREKALNFQPAAELQLDTKYSRSLDDIKQEYTNWMRHQRTHESGAKPSGRRPKKIIPDTSAWILRGAVALGLTALAGIGFLILRDSTASTPNIIAAAHSGGKQEPKPVLPVAAKNESVSEPQELKKRLPQTEPVRSKKRKTVTATPAPVVVKQPVSQPIATPQQTVAKTEVAPVPETKPAEKPSVKNSVTASGYSDGKAAGKWTVVVNNNSHEVLKMVAVDVHYSKDGKKTAGKTVYLNNIAAQSSASASVKLPKKVQSVTYKIGLISSEKGAIYFARH